MKEQTLIEMKNKVETLVRGLQQVIDEQQHLTALASGTIQALRLMPGYEDAIKILTEKAKQNIEDSKKISDELGYIAANAVIVE